MSRAKAKRPTIGELRERVKVIAAALARDGSDGAAFGFSAILLDCLGWCDNFKNSTWKRKRNGVCALVDIADRESVEMAVRQGERVLKNLGLKVPR